MVALKSAYFRVSSLSQSVLELLVLEQSVFFSNKYRQFNKFIRKKTKKNKRKDYLFFFIYTCNAKIFSCIWSTVDAPSKTQ